ncbi:MAG: helix-turn-helix transcriptional regulator [Fibrobacterota bacterium]
METVKCRVTGVSMLPVLKPGQTVLCAAINPKDILPGDICVFSHKNRILIHRLIYLEKDCLFFSGDNRLFFEFVPEREKSLIKYRLKTRFRRGPFSLFFCFLKKRLLNSGIKNSKLMLRVLKLIILIDNLFNPVLKNGQR